MSPEEKRHEITDRRAEFEPRLRRVIQNQLRTTFSGNEVQAKQCILRAFDAHHQRKYASYNYKDFFDPKKVNTTLNLMKDLICQNWDRAFYWIFDDKQRFKRRMEEISEVRNFESHSAVVTDDEMDLFRGAMTWLEDRVNNYLGQ